MEPAAEFASITFLSSEVTKPQTPSQGVVLTPPTRSWNPGELQYKAQVEPLTTIL